METNLMILFFFAFIVAGMLVRLWKLDMEHSDKKRYSRYTLLFGDKSYFTE